MSICIVHSHVQCRAMLNCILGWPYLTGTTLQRLRKMWYANEFFPSFFQSCLIISQNMNKFDGRDTILVQWQWFGLFSDGSSRKFVPPTLTMYKAPAVSKSKSCAQLMFHAVQQPSTDPGNWGPPKRLYKYRCTTYLQSGLFQSDLTCFYEPDMGFFSQCT